MSIKMVLRLFTTLLFLCLVTFVYGQDCGTLAAPTNGIVDVSGTTTGSTATYSCDAGYLLDGTQIRTCQGANVWSSTAPTCGIKDCGALSHPTNGAVDVSSGTTYLGQATYTCDTGYTVLGDTTRTCQQDGTWSSTAPTCQIKDCGSLNNPSNGVVSVSDGTEYGDSATYQCTVGYTLAGSTTRSCQADATWSNSAAVCSIKDCGSPSAINNGQYSAPQTTYQAVATYSCNTNYAIVGSATITCQSDATWDSNTPTCGVDCGSPSSITDGSVTTPGGTAVGAEATYSCNSGYTLSGGATVTCQAAGSWTSGPSCVNNLNSYGSACQSASDCQTTNGACLDPGTGTPVCTCSGTAVYDSAQDSCLADCGGLSSPTNGAVAVPTQTIEGQIATYTCNSGYALSGSGTRTCESSGSWSGSAPTCTGGCAEPDPPLNGQVNITDGFTAGSVVTYSCDSGYALVGSASRVCLMDTTWNGQAPTCNRECSVLTDVKDGTVDLSLGNWAGSVATYICDKNYALVGQSTRTCQTTGLWSGVEPNCIFGMFPDILIVFGVLFMVLFLVDIVVLGIWLYQKIKQAKKEEDEEEEEEDPEDKGEEKKTQFLPFMVERPDDGMAAPPLSFHNSRKNKYTKIAPEMTEDPEIRLRNTHAHPPPRRPAHGLPKVEKIDRSMLMKTPRDKKKVLAREKTFESTTFGPGKDKFRPEILPKTQEPGSFAASTRETKQVNVVDDLYNGNSDDSNNKRQPSPAEADQFSLEDFDTPEPKGGSTMDKNMSSSYGPVIHPE